MSKLDFITNDKPYTIPKVIRKPMPGFKFAVGDRVRYKGKIGVYGTLCHIFGRYLHPGDILTISGCMQNPYSRVELREMSVYGFEEDIKSNRRINYTAVEEHFELVN